MLLVYNRDVVAIVSAADSVVAIVSAAGCRRLRLKACCQRLCEEVAEAFAELTEGTLRCTFTPVCDEAE